MIGDHDRQLTNALMTAAPGAQVTSVGTYFDAIAELGARNYTTIMASAAVKQISSRMAPAMQLAYVRAGAPMNDTAEGFTALTHAVRVAGKDVGSLSLTLPQDEEPSAARHFLAQISHLVGKMAALEDQ